MIEHHDGGVFVSERKSAYGALVLADPEVLSAFAWIVNRYGFEVISEEVLGRPDIMALGAAAIGSLIGHSAGVFL